MGRQIDRELDSTLKVQRNNPTIGVGSCNHTFGGSISISPSGAFYVIDHINHAWLSAGHAVGWSSLVAWTSSRAVAVRFKAPFTFDGFQ